MATKCRLHGALPRAGGLLDQDAYQMHLIESVYAVQAENRKRKKPTG